MEERTHELKVGGCVVLYNPNVKVLDNIETYRNKLDKLVVVDNSDRPDDYIIRNLKSKKNVSVISMRGNKGIAKALNVGCSYLVDHDFDICLTMDSDSMFPKKYYDKITSIIFPIINDGYGLIGLNYNYFPVKKNNRIILAKYWLTSGNFVNLKAYKEVGGFKDKLFIDYVDIEFDHSLVKAGYKVGYLKDYSLKHRIGNPIKKRIFGRTITSMNHAPIRYYYRYRNSRYLYKMDKKYYGAKYWSEILFNIPKMIIFEKNRRKKIYMILKGRKDANLRKLGKLNLKG